MFALTRSTAALVLSTAAAALTLAAGPASAASYNWYSSSNPLVAWEDGAQQALAYGTSYQKDGYLKNHTNYRDPRPGGDDVYTETSYAYYKWCNTAIQWCSEVGKDQSARDDSGKWQSQYDADDYSSRNAERGRIFSKVCEDQNNSGDPCSRKPYFTFSL